VYLALTLVILDTVSWSEFKHIILCDYFDPGVDSASNRNEYQESLKIKKPGGKVRPAHRADNLAAIY
jgi:hypothetical protein